MNIIKIRLRKKRIVIKRRLACAAFIIVAVISCAVTVYNMKSISATGDILDIAYSEVGNTGGRKYWSWYGFDEHVDWCACFVSWCLYKSGIDEPKFSVCDDGIKWFIDNNKWQNKDVKPKSGMIIFFDKNDDGISDHTGIVGKYENGMVYTVEGNINDKCEENVYTHGDKSIAGYGVLSD